MKQQLEEIRARASAALSKAKAQQDIESLRVQFLGKKGELTAILKQMGKLSPEERPVIGQLANKVRAVIEQDIESRAAELKQEELARRLKEETLDVTLPGSRHTLGRKHPLSIVLEEIEEIFVGMGFDIVDGPEVETDYYNFEALNTPKNHPARDTQDTFYINENILLRTQTSSVQVRVMEKQSRPSALFLPAVFTAPTRWTPPIPPSSTRSRVWWWTKALPLQTLRARWKPSSNAYTARILLCAFAPIISPLPSPPQK